MKKLILLFLFLPLLSLAQDAEQEYDKSTYQNAEFYDVKNYTEKKPGKHIKNIIFLIGDGMGVSQVYAGLVANKGNLYLRTMPYAGFSKTNSADKLITDSAAGATAFSIGEKTNNGAIGVDRNNVPKKTILEMADASGLSTGLVATCAITHATPASFIAHQPSRGMAEEIAADFLNTDIDVFIGGGRDHFAKRKDGRNLLLELKAKNYEVFTSFDSLKYAKGDKVAALVYPDQPDPYLLGRGNMLPEATTFAINKLQKNKKGFFLMVEGSQIDWGGHDNNVPYTVSEMLDFDRTIGEALKFAASNKETLVVVTADHETGGLAISGGDLETGLVKGAFTTGSHTGVMVPIFAYGPHAEQFSGIMENTEFFDKFRNLLGLK